MLSGEGGARGLTFANSDLAFRGNYVFQMAQGWYRGGLDVIDFTDAKHPYEIAYFDRGPVDATKLVTAVRVAGRIPRGAFVSRQARGGAGP